MQMNFIQMVKYQGYPIMEYETVTDDGYRLTVHRIPGAKDEKTIDAIKNCKEMNKKSVLLIHGIGSNSQGFVLQQDGSIPY